MTGDTKISIATIDDELKPVTTKKALSYKRYLRGTNIKDIITVLSSILVPVVLGVFTILSTYNQWSMENSRNKQQSELESERHQQQISMNLDKYRNDLLVDYIEKMGAMLEKHNFSLTHDLDLAALASAKSLSTLAQLDPHRVSRVIRFLYDTKLIENSEQRAALDISTANLSFIDKEVLKRKQYRGGLILDGILLENTMLVDVLLENTKFKSAKLHNISFSSSTTDYDDQSMTIRRSTVMIDVDFALTFINRVDFISAKLENICFFRAKLQEASFLNGTLDQVRFTNATLQKVDYSYGQLKKVSFDKAQLHHVSFHGAKLFENTFRETNMVDVDFSFARLISVTFSRTKMKRVNFTQAVFYNVTFEDGATLSYVYYDRAMFYNVKFTETTLEYVEFVSVAFCE